MECLARGSLSRCSIIGPRCSARGNLDQSPTETLNAAKGGPPFLGAIAQRSGLFLVYQI